MSTKLVLIVEDNDKNRKLVRDVLQWKGYATLDAASAEEGIALAQAHRPALILMDIHLPGMDGMQAFEILRGDPRTQNIPVIAVTASAMTHDQQKILAAGFDGYQRKPLEIKEFLAAVTRMLEGEA